jgi:hypothetical protein
VTKDIRELDRILAERRRFEDLAHRIRMAADRVRIQKIMVAIPGGSWHA